MATIAKMILISILAGVVFILVLQLAFFFPFYMSIVVEAFNIANIAANDNYVKYDYYEDAIGNLQNRPMFDKFLVGNEPQITAYHEDKDGEYKEDAIERVRRDESFYNAEEGLVMSSGVTKPYRQRGKKIKIKVEAWYPLRMTLWGREVAQNDVHASFSMVTTTLKYYKDLELE
ncbi:MAG: hypothetical protein LBB91_00620 [Clostridiales bacterium]|jgi:hypothetical protein|nr:hypothetical protein [Clostridiales bacterium]